MTPRALHGAISETTLDVVRIRSLAEMAYQADADAEQVETVLNLIIELAGRANTRFCELANEAQKLEHPAPVALKSKGKVAK